MYTGRIIIEIETEDGIKLERKSAVTESDLETLKESFSETVFYRSGRMVSDLLESSDEAIEEERQKREEAKSKKKTTKKKATKKAAPKGSKKTDDNDKQS